MSRYHISLGDVIGHNESLTSPYHHELYAAWRCQTHADWTRPDMDRYRTLLARLARQRQRPARQARRPREVVLLMEQRVSLVTLGVADLGRARAFYEGLGWTTGAGPDDDVVFFQAGGMIVALWGRESARP